MNTPFGNLGLPSPEQLKKYRIWDSYFLPSYSKPGSDGSSATIADIERTLPTIKLGQIEKLCYFSHVGLGTTHDKEFEQAVRANPDLILKPLERWPKLLIGMIQLNVDNIAASLDALNRWLRDHGSPSVRVPSRERSLQIFADEKKLDRISDPDGRLFNGLLSLDDLGCFTVPLPLPYEIPPSTVPGRPLLVLENHHSYWSFCQWNRGSHAYAAIAYGSGDAFRSAARHLDRIREHARADELRYFGDIDPKGLAIGCDVDQARQALGLTPLRPASSYYRDLLRQGIPRPLAPKAIEAMPAQRQLINWLGQDLSTEIQDLFDHGKWLPQEALGLEQLMAPPGDPDVPAELRGS